MILGDGAMGQMMEPVVLKAKDSSNLPEKTWATNGHKNDRKPNIINSLYIQPDELERTVVERFKRYDIIKQNEQQWEEFMTNDADIILTAYGITSRVAKSAVRMAREKGLKAGLIRPITLWPFPTKAFDKVVNSAHAFLCIEMSMGQMVEDVRLTVNGAKPVQFFGRTGGIVPTPNEVLAEIEKLAGGAK
jgi:2-oxoglutarate ferredoxin oxidoreductase subunit alpha